MKIQKKRKEIPPRLLFFFLFYLPVTLFNTLPQMLGRAKADDLTDSLPYNKLLVLLFVLSRFELQNQ